MITSLIIYIYTHRYGGSILKTCSNDLIIFSGTVFKEILIWKINNDYIPNKNIAVLHRLTGHKVSVFVYNVM